MSHSCGSNYPNCLKNSLLLNRRDVVQQLLLALWQHLSWQVNQRQSLDHFPLTCYSSMESSTARLCNLQRSLRIADTWLHWALSRFRLKQGMGISRKVSRSRRKIREVS